MEPAQKSVKSNIKPSYTALQLHRPDFLFFKKKLKTHWRKGSNFNEQFWGNWISICRINTRPETLKPPGQRIHVKTAEQERTLRI